MYEALLNEARQPWCKVTALGQQTLKPPIIDKLADALEQLIVTNTDLCRRLCLFQLEQTMLVAAIRDCRYMDPPDGGDVPLFEQVRRMRAEVDSLLARLPAVPVEVPDETDFC